MISKSEAADFFDPKKDNSIRKKAWLVDYYASWCPHCQRFVKPYSEL